jgi:subtilisin family serine protease
MLRSSPEVLYVQKNSLLKMMDADIDTEATAIDPLFQSQWGMKDIGAPEIWNNITPYALEQVIVGVIDSGVDWKHEDLNPNIWMNKGEMGVDAQGRDKATNGIDDDGNGYIDDVRGYDFAGKDNDPMDEVATQWEMIFGGGNPGHGTHCAGNVAARGFNGKGIVGVAPYVKIMPLRFITKKGEGTTADAVLAIKYGVDNGAKVLSNSWGSEGDDTADAQGNLALKEAIQYAADHDVLFIAAAGNGHQGAGYDNDTDPAPGVPASYDFENIISVAAIDVNNQLGSFSNWGKRTVDLAAPGVKVFSTVPANQYNDVVLKFMGQTVYWDGTSMATPHVAGAAALYWALHPEKNALEVKAALLKSVIVLDNMKGKLLSGGKLNVKNLLKIN